jgi:hypothetical protein
MKKLFLLITVITAIAATGYGQVDSASAKPNKEYIRNQYFTKAKKQKIAAWICLGGGFALATTGIIRSSTKYTEDVLTSIFLPKAEMNSYTGETILMLAGIAGMAASVPLFVASGKNKHQANLMLTMQKTAEGLPLTVARNFTGLTLSISL